MDLLFYIFGDIWAILYIYNLYSHIQSKRFIKIKYVFNLKYLNINLENSINYLNENN